MEPAELVKIANDLKPKTYSEKIILLNRLVLSMQKIIDSFQDGASNSKAPQEIHMQLIENIFFQAAHLFDDKTMRKFFEIKNKLDAGILNLPLRDDYKATFTDLLDKVRCKLRQLRYLSCIWEILIRFLAIVVIIYLGILAAVTLKSKIPELTGKKYMTGQQVGPYEKSDNPPQQHFNRKS